MNIGDTFSINLSCYHNGVLSDRNLKQAQFKILDILRDNKNEKKDLFLCKEMNYGYRECFHRIDLEGKLCK